MDEATDEDLIAQSRLEGLRQERRDQILNELFARYHSRVALWCYRSTGDRESAADLAQDVLLKAWRYLDSWRGDSKFSTWMYSITRNHCRNEFTARSSRPEASSDSIDSELPDSSEGPHRQFERETEMRQMKHLLATELDATEAQVMTLHYAEEMKLDAITRLLALRNQSGAKAYVVSARRKLQAAVARVNAMRAGRGTHG